MSRESNAVRRHPQVSRPRQLPQVYPCRIQWQKCPIQSHPLRPLCPLSPLLKEHISCSHRVSKFQCCSPVSSFSKSMDLGHSALTQGPEIETTTAGERQPLSRPSGQLCGARLDAFHHQPHSVSHTVASHSNSTTWTLKRPAKSAKLHLNCIISHHPASASQPKPNPSGAH